MIDQKLDMVDFMIENNLLTEEQLKDIETSFIYCTQYNNCSYTKDQIERMKLLIEKQRIIRNTLNNIKNIGMEDVYEKLVNSSNNSYLQESKSRLSEYLNNFHLTSSQESYIKNEIPMLQKKKIIK